MWPQQEKAGTGKGLLVIALGAAAVVSALWVADQVRLSWTSEGSTFNESRSVSAAHQEAQQNRDDLMANGRLAVRQLLVEPDSARFADLRTHVAENGVGALCGTVNARNGYGGYIGDTRFISLGQPEHTWLDDGSVDFSGSYLQFCFGVTGD